MRKETKFNYGYLTAGIGVPYLIDKLFGPKFGLATAIVFAAVGVLFLIFGHIHREKGEPFPVQSRLWRAGIFVLIGAVSGSGIIGVGWALRHGIPVEVQPSKPPQQVVDGSSNTRLDQIAKDVTEIKQNQLDQQKIKENLEKLTAQTKSVDPRNLLKKRALQVSHDILAMLSEQAKKQPPPQEILADRDEWFKKSDALRNETRRLFIQEYSSEAVAVLEEMKDIGIEPKSQLGGTDLISNCQAAINDLMIQDIGISIGVLADKIKARPHPVLEQKSTGDNSPNVATFGDNSPATVTISPEKILSASIVTYDFNGVRRTQTWKKNLVEAGEETNIFHNLMQLQTAKDWKQLRDVCEEQIKKTPEWLTPYLLAGVAYANLGQRGEAVKRLTYVKKQAAGNPDYAEADRLLNELQPKN